MICSRPRLLLLLAASLCGSLAGGSRPAWATPRARLFAPDWYRKAELLADHHTIGRLLKRQRALDSARGERYRLPVGTYLLGTRIVRGVGQPGYQLYSLRDTAFMYSWKRYWPASCVKLVAAVGALWTLGRHGLDGRTHVIFTDDDGSYSGKVHRLQRRALRVSTNVDYNRLMEIAGFEALNERYLTARWGLPRMVMQRRYTHPTPDSNLRRSPPIQFRRGRREGVIPERRSTRKYARCPKEANCTTLFELQEVLRRVMLHPELPAIERFPLRRSDLKRLYADLLASPNKIAPRTSEALGRPLTIYNKAGRVPGDDHLDNAFVVDPKTKRRVMLAMSVPYGAPKEPDELTKKELEELGVHALRVLFARSTRGVWLQHDAGVAIGAKLHAEGELELTAPAGHRVEVWVGRRRLTKGRGVHTPTKLALPSLAAGDHALVLIARRGRRAVGYRFVGLSIGIGGR